MVSLAVGAGSELGCQRREPLLRVGSHLWPGYEMIYLARAQNYFSEQAIRLVEMPSATAVSQALGANTLEAACLTLDEVLTARAEGIDLVVVAVLDVSLGADVLLAHPEVRTLQHLKGKRIGVEQNALGAVMLDAVLHRAALTPSDVQVVAVTVDQHAAAYREHVVDAVITFEPVTSQLLQQGARTLFTSAEIPGRIVDVLAVQRAALETHPAAIRALLAGHFRAREAWLNQPEQFSSFVASRLQLDVAQLPVVFGGIELTDLAHNRDWLSTQPPRLAERAADLVKIMSAAGLLPRPVSLANLGDARFLPGGLNK